MSIRRFSCFSLLALLLIVLSGCQISDRGEENFFAAMETLPGVRLSLSSQPPKAFKSVAWDRVIIVNENGGTIWLFVPAEMLNREEYAGRILPWLESNEAIPFLVGDDRVFLIPAQGTDALPVIISAHLESWMDEDGLSLLWKTHGDVLRENGNIDESIAAYSRATSLNPSFLDAYLSLGEAFLIKGDRESAYSSFSSALSIDPYNYSALRKLGTISVDLHRSILAVQPLTKAYILKPEETGTLLFIALALGESGRREDALRVLDEAETKITDEEKLKTINDIRMAFSVDSK